MNDKLAIIEILKSCLSKDENSLNYRGFFEDSYTEQLITLSRNKDDKKTNRRMALLISESFQNILRHGEGQLEGNKSSLFGVRGIDQFLHIFSANYIDLATKEFLEKRLTEINLMDKDQIKAFYTDALENGVISNSGGAGLGLIEMARKSEHPIQKCFMNVDDLKYAFYMQVDLFVNNDLSTDLKMNPMPIAENQLLHKIILDHDVVFLYKGDFCEEVMYPILNIMQKNAGENLVNEGFNIFLATVEMMQNITRYCREIEGKKVGIFLLNKTKKGYYVSTGNPVEGDGAALIDRILKYNTYSKTELDDLYRKKLKENVLNPGNSAGVGLIDLRRRMMTSIDVRSLTDDTGAYLLMGVEIPYSNG
jgi:hypothetical protein